MGARWARRLKPLYPREARETKETSEPFCEKLNEQAEEST